jgi:hypothetical protein
MPFCGEGPEFIVLHGQVRPRWGPPPVATEGDESRLRHEMSFRLIGYVVMPEHVHLLIE